jgi:hypothetical protein
MKSKNLFLFLSIVVFSWMLTACGGGGANNNNDDDGDPDTDGGTKSINTAYLIDSAIEGIQYKSGGLEGYTDINGMFKYENNNSVKFFIGDEASGIPLGSANVKTDPYNDKKKIITLFDLAGTQDENNQKVVNMGKLLQSLDTDKDVSNGITIDDRTKESIALLGLKDKIDFNFEIDKFHKDTNIYMLFNDLATHFGEHRGLINTDDVKAHLVAVRDNKFSNKQYNNSALRTKKQPTVILKGVFKTVGGVVEGVAYRSGNQFGRTDANGEYSYEEGKSIKFYIYQLELGITKGKYIITPADLVVGTSFNHPKPRNIIRLLNAFDADGTAGGNVKIDNAVRQSLEIYRSQIDLNLPDGAANTDLGISKGEDEFGAQFEDFEIGKEILDKIAKIRGES